MNNMRKCIKSENNRISKNKSNDEEVDMNITSIRNDHLVKCELCDTRFQKMSDLENHIMTKHELHKTYESENCRKKLLTSWRLNKHDEMHTSITIRIKYVQICEK